MSDLLDAARSRCYERKGLTLTTVNVEYVEGKVQGVSDRSVHYSSFMNERLIHRGPNAVNGV